MQSEGSAAETEWTIGRLLRWTADYLGRQGIEDARLATEVLLAHAAECRRIDLYTRFEETLHRPQLDLFRGWVRRAAANEPIAYVVGEKEFFSLAFSVTPDVLIPRPETETLVEAALDHCTEEQLTRPRLLDVGTGSGCIAIALLAQLADATAVATDVSNAALEVAKRNAERHGVLERFTTVEATGLTLPPDIIPAGGFNLVVCNPPYVPREEVSTLDASVRGHEPMGALTDDADGLSLYRELAAHAPSILTSSGVVVVEVGEGQASAAVETMTTPGLLVHRETRKDRVVGRERVLVFRRP
ncbi:MAG: peptide chain release factor N(5)-glutamine methyltransferase [Phycisphaerae bacterium]